MKPRIWRGGGILATPREINTLTAPWWYLTGISIGNILAAYQPKGADDQYTCYMNLVNLGTYDALPGVAPDWDTVNGWKFNGSTHYLDTGIVPVGGGSLFVKFTTLTNNGCLAGQSNGASAKVYLNPDADGANSIYANGATITIAGNYTTGVAGVAGQQGYKNGAAHGGAIGAWAGAGLSIYIGNNHGAPDFAAVYIQALVYYSVVLTALQAATLSTAMAAL